MGQSIHLIGTKYVTSRYGLSEDIGDSSVFIKDPVLAQSAWLLKKIVGVSLVLRAVCACVGFIASVWAWHCRPSGRYRNSERRALL